LAGKTLEDYVKDLDVFVSRNIKKIPYGRLQVWKNLLFEPLPTIKSEVKNASFMGGAKDVAVASLAYMIIIALYMAEYMGFFFGIALLPVLFVGGTKGIGACIVPAIIGLLVVIALIIASSLFAVFGWLFSSGLEFLLARLLGGNGEFKVHAYLEALSNAAMMATLVPVMALYIIPCFLLCIGIIAQPFMIALSLYSLYIRYLIVKQVHNLPRNKAIAAVVIPVVVFFVLAVIFYFGLFALNVVAEMIKAAATNR